MLDTGKNQSRCLGRPSSQLAKLVVTYSYTTTTEISLKKTNFIEECWHSRNMDCQFLCLLRSVQFTLKQSRIRALAPNAFAVQIRRALEALCEDRNADGRNLATQLGDLAKKNEIPSVLVELADTLRLVGNVGAHSGNQTVHQLQAYEIDEFFRVLIEYVYIAPNKLAAFRKRLGK